MLVCFLRAGMAQERKTFGQPSRTVEQLAVELGAGATLEDLKDYVSSQHIAHEQKKNGLRFYPMREVPEKDLENHVKNMTNGR